VEGGPYNTRANPAASSIERNVQFLSKLMCAERTTSKVALANFQSRHLALAMICAEDDFFGFRILFDIHFVKCDGAFLEESFRAAAIGAPARAIDCDGFHVGR